MTTQTSRELTPYGDYNPIDNVEEVLESNNWIFSRLNEDELAVQICGHGGEYRLSFHWDEGRGALEFACHFDTAVSEANYAAAIKAILAVNAQSWIGHFDLPADTMTPVFRYTSLFQGVGPGNGSAQIDGMVRVALDQCEEHYPLFALLAGEDAVSDAGISLAMTGAAGQA